MMRFFAIILVSVIGLTQAAMAQTSDDFVWVQIEAQPSYQEALERVEEYTRDLPDVNGFAMRSGWFGIAMGPYLQEDAELILRSYRAQGRIPGDSYIARSADYQQQYWPTGADMLGLGVLALAETAPSAAEAAIGTEPQSQVAAETDPDLETRADARRSESLLSRDEKRNLQAALEWAGYYNAAIDGAFGRGTRNAMAAWQSANGYDSTGILTTRQRAELMQRFNAILEGLDIQLVRDSEAGIQIKMPTGLVRFDRYDPPFAQYNPKDGETARLLLISQEGDRATLNGLFEIMQTLEIVPLEGPRTMSRNSFVLVGQNDSIVSETRATLENGEIKGFTLVWPAQDEERRARLLAEIESSFIRLPGTLDPALGTADQQAIDLVSGLQVRQPVLSRSGFFVDDTGAVVTTASAVQNCTRITLDDLYDAQLAQVDAELGVALLRPEQSLAPPSIARFSRTAPRLQSEVAVAGYSFEGQLNAPSLTFGKFSDNKGLQGEVDLNRLALDALPGDEGGPVFDDRGNVMGMLVPPPTSSRKLPDDVRFALTVDAITGVMSQAGLPVREGTETASLAPEDITDRGVGMTVLVSCWE